MLLVINVRYIYGANLSSFAVVSSMILDGQYKKDSRTYIMNVGYIYGANLSSCAVVSSMIPDGQHKKIPERKNNNTATLKTVDISRRGTTRKQVQLTPVFVR